MTAHTYSHLTPRERWEGLFGIGLGVLMFTIDISIVNIAVPTLMAKLQTSFATIQWVVESYLLVIVALVLTAARLGDMYGKKRLYLGGLALFTFASLLCGLAPGAEMLIASRTLQGLGAVFMAAMGPAIVTDLFPPEKRGKALGVIGAIVSLGIALGPGVGGFLLALAGWRSIFLINVPIGILATMIIIKKVPASRHRAAKQPFDFAGAVLFAAAFTCFAVGMIHGQEYGFGNRTTVGLLVFAPIALALFLAREATARYPMLNLRLFRSRTLSVGLAAGALVFIVVAGFVFVIPFYFEQVLGFSTAHTGLLMMVSPLLGGVVAPMAGGLSDRIGQRFVSSAGLFMMLIGCIALSTLGTDSTDWGYVFRVALFGTGIGFFQAPNNSAIMGSVPPEARGIGGGLLSLSRTSGQVSGLPIMAAVFGFFALGGFGTSAEHMHDVAPERIVAGLRAVFLMSAVVIGAALALTLFVKREKRAVEGKVSAAEPIIDAV